MEARVFKTSMGCLFKASVRVGGAFSYFFDFVYIIYMYSVRMYDAIPYILLNVPVKMALSRTSNMILDSRDLIKC